MRRHSSRRGIVLLMVLSLMILFLLIGITYILQSTQFMQGARAAANLDRYGDIPKHTLQNAMWEIIRGSENTRSRVREFSLLEGIYGNPLSNGTITSISRDTNSLWVVQGPTPGANDGFYNGCVFTITTGLGSGISTRIVSDQLKTSGKLYVLALGGESSLPATNPEQMIRSGDKYLINGRPFSVTGAGGAGNRNVDYTAPDENTMVLAWQSPTPGATIIPSYHRQNNSLRFNVTQSSGQPFNATTGPWDVDNDGDGILDSVWVDFGFPLIALKDGRTCRPLFAVLCLDLDGRINVNAHGNLALTSAAGGGTRGLGFGPAEINLASVFSGQASSLMSQRYGMDGQPGSGGGGSYGSQYQFDYINTSSSWGSPLDLQGQATVALDNHGNPDWQGFAQPNGASNPYQINLGANTGRPGRGDNQYSAADLEGLLRAYDIDASLLPSRLRDVISPTGSGGQDQRQLVGTDGYHVPPMGLIRTNIVEALRTRLAGVADIETQMAIMLPRELRDGLPMNLNKSLGYSASSGDDPRISPTLLAKYPLYVRQIQARHLFVLLNLLGVQLTPQQMAQFSINAVQFMYNDSVMVPFEYQDNPFTGWTVDGDPTTNEGGKVVWGCTFPDVLLQETVAFHDRRVKDTAYDTNDKQDTVNNKPAKRDTMKNPDETLDQVRIPQGTLIFKLYCARSDRDPTRLPTDLYAGGKLDLGKMAPPKNGVIPYPVWRVAITPSIKNQLSLSGAGPATGNPGILDNPATTDPAVVERIVWFASQSPAGNPEANKIFNNRGGAAQIAPGTYVMVGPRDKTAVGMDDKDLTTPQLITLPANSILCGADRPQIDWGPADGLGPNYIGLNISEPMPSSKYYLKPRIAWNGTTNEPYKDAYGEEKDGSKDFPDVPFDEDVAYNGPLQRDVETGTRINFRTLFLQRLADPNREFDKDSNPYITIDWMPVDLTVFNGMDQNPNPNSTANPFDKADANPGGKYPIKFSSRQRGSNALTDKQTLWPCTTDDPVAGGKNSNNFSYDLANSFGGANKTYTGTLWPWLTWNARPYVSPLELMMVPLSSPSRLTTEFSLPSMQAAPANVYQTGAAPYRHLLNFLQAGNLSNLFNYVDVQSRYAGSLTWIDEKTNIGNWQINGLPQYHPPFNYVSNFRDPGRVNLNTINDKSIWDALLNGAPGPSWDQFVSNRRGYGTSSNVTEPVIAPATTYFASPFRPSAGIASSFLRPDRTAGPGSPLFYASSMNPTNDTTRNAYFTYQQMMRIANLTTTRSNVFAVWVTVGYFDGGVEVGSDDGTVKRHRMFFIYDRSIPVAFERGMNHNVPKGLLLQKYIE